MVNIKAPVLLGVKFTDLSSKSRGPVQRLSFLAPQDPIVWGQSLERLPCLWAPQPQNGGRPTPDPYLTRALHCINVLLVSWLFTLY